VIAQNTNQAVLNTYRDHDSARMRRDGRADFITNPVFFCKIGSVLVNYNKIYNNRIVSDIVT
jgi:hypothetical protein